MLSDKEKKRKAVEHFQQHLDEALKDRKDMHKAIIAMIFTVLTVLALAYLSTR